MSLNSEDSFLHRVKQVMTNSGVKCVDAWEWEGILLPEIASVLLHVMLVALCQTEMLDVCSVERLGE